MLIPKEKPYLTGLNSYYLKLDKLVEHLQGDIGSGSLYFQAPDQELQIFFDEQEIVRGIIQKNGRCARISPDIEPILYTLAQKNFLVTIYYLDQSSIFFWAQMPAFQRARKALRSTKITLPDLIYRLKEKKISGFVDVSFSALRENAILFFHHGDRKGGSYSWGKGGLSPSDDDYNRLLVLLQKNDAVFNLGHYESKPMSSNKIPESKDDNQYFSDLETAMADFLALFLQTSRKKIKTDPIIQLKQKFFDHLDEYPVLDPFRNLYILKDDATIEFINGAPREEIVEAIIDCTWKVVDEKKLLEKFKSSLQQWAYKTALEERGISVDPPS